MWVLGWMVMVVLLPGQVLAAPLPPPPGDFPGAQYIDSTGCVFVREDQEWVPRLDRKGGPICGFPPSKGAEAAPSPELPSPEEALADMLAQGLRAGDLVTDRPAAPLPDVPADPAQAVLDAQLQDQIAIERRMRSALGGPVPVGLCEKLGYRPAEGTTSDMAADVTQGLCPGMTAPELRPRVIAADDPAAPETAPKPKPQAAVTAPAVPARKTDPTKGQGSVTARRPSAPKAEPAPRAEVIPASARYVEIGAYADPANALAALRRLSELGFRTAQRDQKIGGKAGKAVLAGPFADRQSLVAALNRLRSNGYPRAVAR